ncbi:MAG: FAD:protein FMN transferase [Paracoccus sp. (in: a-proteobacteria)]
MNRRRFLTVTAALAGAAALSARSAPPQIRQWHGTALGARATIAFDHPQAARLIALARAEIDRLEDIFSLYRPESALARLNRAGQLEAPPFELLECLSLCGQVHAASGGRFDPGVQPVWAAHAAAWSAGAAPSAAALAQARAVSGWQQVEDIGPDRIRLGRPGAALTLNGAAQGVIADRIADLLRAEGLSDVLVDAGEIAARGHMPDGQGWPVTLAGSGRRLVLSDRAVASSALRGTVFDPAGEVGHILDPQTGLPADAGFASVSISAPRAGLADALSTAACLLPDEAALNQMLAAFPGARAEAFTRA